LGRGPIERRAAGGELQAEEDLHESGRAVFGDRNSVLPPEANDGPGPGVGRRLQGNHIAERVVAATGASTFMLLEE
jgi:hypothetical protein